ncbi:MAG: PilZ domain-containing protein [Burkholderiales bacterium]
MSALHRPETDDSVLRDYRIAEPSERARLLAELVSTGDLVSIYENLDAEQCLESRLLAYDPARDSLEFEILPKQIHSANVVSGSAVVAVAVMARVKLQFEISPITVDVDARKFQTKAPSSVVRLQRRDAFRVIPPREAAAYLFVGEAISGSQAWRTPVLDLSASGLAFEWRNSTPPERGAILPFCRIELAGVSAITCQLRVISTKLQEPLGSHIARVGGEFIGLDSSAARAIQVYVNAAQTRSRARKPILS